MYVYDGLGYTPLEHLASVAGTSHLPEVFVMRAKGEEVCSFRHEFEAKDMSNLHDNYCKVV